MKFDFGSRAADACQIWEWQDHYNTQSCGFETSRDLAVRRLTVWWIEALDGMGEIYLHLTTTKSEPCVSFFWGIVCHEMIDGYLQINLDLWSIKNHHCCSAEWQILLSVWSSVLLTTKTVPGDKDINVWLIFWYHTAFGNAWLYYFMFFKRKSYCLVSVTMGNINPIPFWGSFERIDPCHVEFVWGNIKICLHCVSFLNTDTEIAQVAEILPCGRQGPFYPAKSIPWLLMTGRYKEPRHQKPY